MTPTILSPREALYQDVINVPYAPGLDIGHRLQELQDSNLLCANEVLHYDSERYRSLGNDQLYAHIQQRVVHHRLEEMKILNGALKKGGFIKVANGSRVQGTTVARGLQPDYIIDTRSPEVKVFVKAVAHLKNSPVQDQIEQTGFILRSEFIQRTEYDDPVYLELMRSYRERGLEVPLSHYLKIQKGVCREISLLTCIALNSLGLESYYYYAKVSTVRGIIPLDDTCHDASTGVSFVSHSTPKEEDHAFVPVNVEGRLVVCDNYFRMFNGHLLSALESPEGVACEYGSMYDNAHDKGRARVIMSRLYPETRHHSKHL